MKKRINIGSLEYREYAFQKALQAIQNMSIAKGNHISFKYTLCCQPFNQNVYELKKKKTFPNIRQSIKNTFTFKKICTVCNNDITVFFSPSEFGVNSIYNSHEIPLLIALNGIGNDDVEHIHNVNLHKTMSMLITSRFRF